jgi:hypothetical protein
MPKPDRRLAEAMTTVSAVTGFIMDDQGDARPPGLKAGSP